MGGLGATQEIPRVPLGDRSELFVIENLDTSRSVNGRLRRKLDLFAVYGLCAANEALMSSRILEGELDKERCGIFVGNCLGGWGYTEPELKVLHTRGVSRMSPFVATAWFPAALQGQLSLLHGIKGYSKTFSTGAVAGVQALGYAAQAIESGRADVILCGAAEDLSSPYVRAILSRRGQEGSSFGSVFGPAKTQSFAEGAAFLVLEDLEHALRRKADVYGEVLAFADGFAPGPEQAVEQLAHNLAAVTGGKQHEHLLLLDGGFEAERTKTEQARGEFALCFADSRRKLGHMFAVSGTLEAACAAHQLRGGAMSARLFADDAPAAAYDSVIIQRLSKNGNVATLRIGRPSA